MNHSPPHNPLPSNGTADLTIPPVHYQQLCQARSPALMRTYLAERLGASVGASRSPACHVLDMKYAPGEQCTLLYQWGDQQLIGILPWNQAPPAAAPAGHIAALDLWLYRFPHDPALPTLAAILDANVLADVLRDVLPACRRGQARLLACRATPLRYRPGRRCTVQIDLRLQQRSNGAIAHQRLYGKLYHQVEKAAAVYAEMQMLADAVTGQEGALTVAQPIAFAPAFSLVVQAPVIGQPLDLLLAHQSPPTVQSTLVRTAQALAALHRLPHTTTRLRPLTNDLTKLTRRAATVATVAPTLGAAMGALGQRLAGLAVALPAWERVAAMGHGDCKPSQFFISPTQVALLDFDHGGMADPAADVGLFLATLRQAQVQQQSRARQRSAAAQERCTTDAHCAAFYTAYHVASGASPHLAQRVAWYEGIALLRKALRSFARSPWSPLPALLVAEAERRLDKIAFVSLLVR